MVPVQVGAITTCASATPWVAWADRKAVEEVMAALVGASVPVSGRYALQGVQLRAGVELWAARAGARLLIEDDRSSPQRAVEVHARLVARGCALMLGPLAAIARGRSHVRPLGPWFGITVLPRTMCSACPVSSRCARQRAVISSRSRVPSPPFGRARG